ncbi:MAG: hypothetical protein KME07_07410 [Pegethrix bostrychoides GSE-TBD4-15B]|jgi:hypothetical protein|uniref:Uncharacterized protein n=1 Tax=Pegethrix bostrychoides GSE-TBD4-15B TaxID=2839662 RepID=A0A951U418_9CYAN|nr:hypothetical protein [Pegethrix bostrychoides GSE-TBD4-15B]
MLIFFLHGVSTKNADYSKPLQNLLRKEFNRIGQPLPHFYAGFWGNVFKQTGQMWNGIHQDLQELRSSNSQADVQDIFRYQELREDFISQFFGDALTYFNTERGLDIRDTLADQLYKFLKNYPQETDLHIVSHSLGTVILWDALFSDRFANDDPAYTIRSLISSHARNSAASVHLKSLTTMGSPIVFFNMMLGVGYEQVKAFTSSYKSEALRWINILHSSDIIAYPLRSGLNANQIPNLFFRDRYVWTDANVAEKAARTFGQVHTAMAVGASDAHCSYWQSRGTARFVMQNLLGNTSSLDFTKIDLDGDIPVSVDHIADIFQKLKDFGNT